MMPRYGVWKERISPIGLQGRRSNTREHALLNAKQFPTIKGAGTSGPVDAKNCAMLDFSGQFVGREIKLTLPFYPQAGGESVGGVGGGRAITQAVGRRREDGALR
jgi:hypothetical protein